MAGAFSSEFLMRSVDTHSISGFIVQDQDRSQHSSFAAAVSFGFVSFRCFVFESGEGRGDGNGELSFRSDTQQRPVSGAVSRTCPSSGSRSGSAAVGKRKKTTAEEEEREEENEEEEGEKEKTRRRREIIIR